MATVVFGDFEWESREAASNQRKHGVSFEEASTVFGDTDYVLKADSGTPDRFHALGMSAIATRSQRRPHRARPTHSHHFGTEGNQT